MILDQRASLQSNRVAAGDVETAVDKSRLTVRRSWTGTEMT